MRKLIVSMLAGLSMVAASATTALAEWEPSGPLRMLIGFDAGGDTDVLGRIIASEMSEATGWTIAVENRPGGGGIAMFTQLAVMPADGQTIGVGVSMPVLINLVLRGDELPFDLTSFDYLATIARAQVGIVAKADAPFDDMAGLIAASQEGDGALVAFDAKPQELVMNYVQAGSEANFRLLSTQSSAEMLQQVLGDHVTAAFATGTHIPYLDSGEIKMIASVNADRHGYAPDVPTLIEQGHDIYVDPYFYIAAPAGLPDDAKATLAEALHTAIESEAVSEIILNTLRTDPSDLGPDGTEQMLVDGLDNVGKLFGSGS